MKTKAIRSLKGHYLITASILVLLFHLNIIIKKKQPKKLNFVKVKVTFYILRLVLQIALIVCLQNCLILNLHHKRILTTK